MRRPVEGAWVTDEPHDMAPARSAATRRPGLAACAALVACSAWAGAAALAAGAIDLGETVEARLPFHSVVLAGIALAIAVAVPFTILAWSAWVGDARTDVVALVAGAVLIAWIVGQVAVIRAFAVFQPAFVAIGACFVWASHRVSLTAHQRGSLFAMVGALLTAVGVGLVPHVVDDGLTITSAISIALVTSGVVAVAVGATRLLGDRSVIVRIVGGVGLLVVWASIVSVVAPAVVATHVRSTEVTVTPAALGLAYDDVSFTTDDGVELAAWYLGGTNGAGVVVLHGAGSTRSSVLEQAAAIAEAGYSLLLVDARGHGDSRGTAMDFGWYGDLDIAAATGYLASRPDVDPGRIGVVGFSMGGEQAIGAAATDPLIRAVVAEGATARQAADKAWMSDAYGWRGWVQERLEAIQYGVVDYLTEASPPTSLRSAVATAVDARFLLISAGEVGDERRAALHIQGGADDRVTIWEVDGARHTEGFATQPDEWRARVVGFLDEWL